MPQPRLDAAAHVANLVEKDRPVIGGFQRTSTTRLAVFGEPGMSEERRPEDVIWHASAPNGDQLGFGTRAPLVNEASHNSLADPRLARDQDASVRSRRQ